MSKNKLCKTVILTLLIFAVTGNILLVPPTSAAELTTSDVYVGLKDTFGDPFEDFIIEAYKANIIKGYSDGTFKSANNVTFVESLKILINAGPKGANISRYATSNDNTWYDPYVKMYTTEDKTTERVFKTDDKITRDFAVYLMLRQLGIQFDKSDYSKIPSKFSDINSTSKFAPYVQFAGYVGISNGYFDGSFGGSKNVTRGELTKMAYRTLIQNRAQVIEQYQKIKSSGKGNETVTSVDSSVTEYNKVLLTKIPTEIQKYLTHDGMGRITGLTYSGRKTPFLGKYTGEQILALAKLKITPTEEFYRYLDGPSKLSLYHEDIGTKSMITVFNEGSFVLPYMAFITGKDGNGNSVMTPFNGTLPFYLLPYFNYSADWHGDSSMSTFQTDIPGAQVSKFTKSYDNLGITTAWKDLVKVGDGWLDENDWLSRYQGQNFTADIYQIMKDIGIGDGWELQGNTLVYTDSLITVDNPSLYLHKGSYLFSFSLTAEELLYRSKMLGLSNYSSDLAVSANTFIIGPNRVSYDNYSEWHTWKTDKGPTSYLSFIIDQTIARVR